tara:strand:+ start:150 stop:1052 length:903 start_codon:yes stop_codon:yes gene_type:complete
MFSYLAYDLNILSEIEIPLLKESELSSLEKSYIEIKENKFLSDEIDFTENTLDFSLSKFYRKGVGYFVIENGKIIYFQKSKGCSVEDFSRTLLHQVFARLLFQKKYICFHAGCISIQSQGFLFTGLSGSGKSTLTSEMIKKRNVKFVSEDTTPIFKGQKNIRPIISFPFIKLDKKFKEINEIARLPEIKFKRDRLQRNGFFLNKELLAKKPLNLRGCFFLEWGTKNEIKKLAKNEIFPLLLANLFKPHSSPKNMDCEKFLLEFIGEFIDSIDCYKLVRNKEKQVDFSDEIYKEIKAISGI